MFTIDVMLKLAPLPLSVQRKTEEDASALYGQIHEAMKSGTPQLLELTCDRQPEKKICVLTSEVCAVQISEKSGGATSGKQPGFFAALTQTEA
ncbi:hypothetical protein IQ235_06390 [Oscillatoriales cyanobacterium LEGE 11467]|uniref:UPF0367 protein IQ235_06390 n=1 Tax=Zarconia navalis LEGE 11467 TaxID=1828826 RepID=A0A928VUK3_9CYAN|nr:hypothetical protein [Zarconia navalis]MBE9040416.1 hypothetical protein [Zarconia navalis LEGE 11467]